MQRSHFLKLKLNGRFLRRVLIDAHYEIRHGSSMSDQLILELVALLDGQERQIETITSSGFEIFRVDPVYWKGKTYRLVLTLPPSDRDDADYVGVINAFRVHDRKRNRKE